MKKTLIALSVCFLSSGAFASADDSIIWTQQNKGLRTLWAVHFIDSLHGWACGDYWSLYKTTNGGANWSQMPLANADSLNGIFFLDCSTGFTASGTGRIYKTLDSGRTWAQAHYRAGWLSDIRFWNKDTGWAVGSARRVPYATYNPVIYRTQNGGQAWDSMSVSGPYSLDFVRTLNGRTVYTGGYNYLCASANAGASWGSPAGFLTMADAAFSSSSGYINTVDFFGSAQGVAVGRYGHILRREPSGSWVTARANDFTWLESVRFADSSRIVIAGERGAVYSSADAGHTWTKRYPRHPSSNWAPWFRSLCIVDPQHLWMAGDSGLIMKGRFYEAPVPVQRNPGDRIPLLEAFPSCGGGVEVRYRLTRPACVSLLMCGPDGRYITRLDQGFLPSGSRTIRWAPDKASGTGIYFLKMILDGKPVKAVRVLNIR